MRLLALSFRLMSLFVVMCMIALPATATLPSAPVGLTATLGTSSTLLSWSPPSGSAPFSYSVYGGADPSSLALLGTTQALTFTVGSTALNVYYAVGGVNADGLGTVAFVQMGTGYSGQCVAVSSSPSVTISIQNCVPH